MARLLQMFVLVLIAGLHADMKILSTPDGKIGPEPCVRVCFGVFMDFRAWFDSDANPGKVGTNWNSISMSDCDFVSAPIVTAVSSSGHDSGYGLCPSLTVTVTRSSFFRIYSASDFTRDKIIQNQCKIYWTASGFTC